MRARRRRQPVNRHLNRRALWHRAADERGAVATEMAVVMFAFFAGFLTLVVFAGRVGQAENDVRSAAHEAARAVTLEPTVAAATTRARAVAASNLAASGIACRDNTVTVHTSGQDPGNWVAVTVTCNADFSDIASLGVPGSRDFTATAFEVIDIHRSRP